MFWNLRIFIIVFINNIIAILTCIPMAVFVLFICLLINTTNCLLNLLDVLLRVIIFLSKVMFAMIHALIDFIYLVMLFYLKINISFPLMLRPCLRYLFFHTLTTCLLLLNSSSLDLCMNDDAQLCLFLSPTRHLSLFRWCLLWLSWILALFLGILRFSRPPNWYGFSLTSFHSTLSFIPIPTCYFEAVKHECWWEAMIDELHALNDNHT